MNTTPLLEQMRNSRQESSFKPACKADFKVGINIYLFVLENRVKKLPLPHEVNAFLSLLTTLMMAFINILHILLNSTHNCV